MIPQLANDFRRAARLSQANQRRIAEALKPLLDEAEASEVEAAQASVDHSASFFDLVHDLEGVFDGPGDLSTNPQHLEGFGASNRP